MVFFFIADLALTLAFRFSAWCLVKTYNGIAYLVTYKTQPQKSNACEAMSDDCTDCVIISMTRQEYDALNDLNHHHPNHSSSEDALVSSSECVSSPSSSK